MPLDELALWAAWFDGYDPELRGDLRAGVMASTVANAALGSRGGYRPSDLMPTLKRQRETDEREMEAQLIAWTANVGGTVKTEKR